ncbi:hypothetical protein F5B18DRAFT_163221 [Nemania serpens]|nr:hypothetical protein F5B18DRAFT_163221 [Nemania serpens]
MCGNSRYVRTEVYVRVVLVIIIVVVIAVVVIAAAITAVSAAAIAAVSVCCDCYFVFLLPSLSGVSTVSGALWRFFWSQNCRRIAQDNHSHRYRARGCASLRNCRWTWSKSLP